MTDLAWYRDNFFQCYPTRSILREASRTPSDRSTLRRTVLTSKTTKEMPHIQLLSKDRRAV